MFENLKQWSTTAAQAARGIGKTFTAALRDL